MISHFRRDCDTPATESTTNGGYCADDNQISRPNHLTSPTTFALMVCPLNAILPRSMLDVQETGHVIADFDTLLVTGA